VGSEPEPLELWSPFAFFKEDWGADVKLTTSYRTETGVSVGDYEQSMARRQVPGRVVEATFRARRSNAQLLLDLFYRACWARRLFPVVPDLTHTTGAVSGTNIPCDATYRRFHVGARAVVMKFDANTLGGTFNGYEIFTIAAVADAALTSTLSISGSFPEGSVVVPLIEAETLSEGSITFHNDAVATFEATASEVAGANQLPGLDGAAWLAEQSIFTIDGYEYPIIYPVIDWKDGMELKARVQGESSVSGNAAIFTRTGENPRWGGNLDFVCVDREEFWNLLRFFSYCKGEAKKFMLCLPIHGLQCYNSGTITDTLYVAVRPTVGDWQRFHRFIAVKPVGGVPQVAAITNATEDFIVNPSGSHKLTLDPPISVAADDVDRVMFVFVAKLEDDSMTEEWLTNQKCLISLNWRSVDALGTAEVPDFDMIQTTPVVTIPNLLACAAGPWPPDDPDPSGDCVECDDCYFDPVSILNYSFTRAFTAGFTTCPTNPYSVSGSADYVSCGVYEDSYYRFSWNGVNWTILWIGSGTDPRSTVAVEPGLCIVCDDIGTIDNLTFDCDEYLHLYQEVCGAETLTETEQFVIVPVCPENE
jgi:hypothetical protein